MDKDSIIITDFDPSCGLTCGIEDGEDFFVQNNLALNTKNEYCYNQAMLFDHQLISDDWLNSNPYCHFFIASPDFGDKINRRGVELWIVYLK